VALMTDNGRATIADLDRQIDSFAEVESIDNRLRWAPLGGIERFMLNLRRAELMARIELWNRRYAGPYAADTHQAERRAV
jgi:hypothetical protein